MVGMTSAPKAARCLKLSAGATAQQRKDAHRAKMNQKRERDTKLGTGFMPVANARIDAAVEANATLVGLEALATGRRMTPAEVQEEAFRKVAAQLQAPRMVRSLRVKPSKNNDPVYRKAVPAEPAQPKRRAARKAA